MKKRKLWISIAGILVIVVISVTQVTKFKFLFEVLRISSSLSTVSSDFYSEPIEDIIVRIAAKNGRILRRLFEVFDCHSKIIYRTIGINFKNPIKVIPESTAHSIVKA